MSTELQIKELNQRIAELALIVSLKTQEMDKIENRYNERLAILNKYINKIQKLVDSALPNGELKDIDLLEKLGKYEEDDDYIIIPKKSIVLDKLDKPKEVNSNDVPVKLPAQHNRRKKMSCSYCNERGHKRSQCPKILYQE